MKKLFYYLSLTCIAVFLVACGTKTKSDKDDAAFVPQKGDIKVILEMDKTGLAPEDVDAVFESTEKILKERLDKANMGLYSMERIKGDESRLLVYARCDAKDKVRLQRQLTMRSQMEFWETYNGDELYSTLQSIIDNSLLTAHIETQVPLDSLNEMDRAIMEYEQQIEERNHGFQFRNMPGSPVVGIADVRDTAAINRMIYSEHAKQVLSNQPWEVRLVWGVKPVNFYNPDHDMMELFALKVTDSSGCAPIDGSVINSAKSEIDDFSKSPMVSITMNNEGTQAWADLTKKNIKRAIAMVIDNAVYIAPTIQSEITGGKVQISGNLTQEEVDDLANLLNAGKLPANVRIISYEEVE